jgi:hypothetical protein
MNSTRAVDVSIQAVSPALICIKAPCTIVAAALPNPLAGRSLYGVDLYRSNSDPPLRALTIRLG